jgi:hypothetical protein
MGQIGPAPLRALQPAALAYRVDIAPALCAMADAVDRVSA